MLGMDALEIRCYLGFHILRHFYVSVLGVAQGYSIQSLALHGFQHHSWRSKGPLRQGNIMLWNPATSIFLQKRRQSLLPNPNVTDKAISLTTKAIVLTGDLNHEAYDA